MIINWKASLLEYHLFRSCSSNLYCDLDPEQWNLSVIGVSRVPNNNICISFGPSTKGSSHLLTKAWIGSYRNSQHYKKKIHRNSHPIMWYVVISNMKKRIWRRFFFSELTSAHTRSDLQIKLKTDIAEVASERLKKGGSWRGRGKRAPSGSL